MDAHLHGQTSRTGSIVQAAELVLDLGGLTPAISRPRPAPRHEKLLPCELGRQAFSKTDSDHTCSADLQGPVLEIEWCAVSGERIEGTSKA